MSSELEPEPLSVVLGQPEPTNQKRALFRTRTKPGSGKINENI